MSSLEAARTCPSGQTAYTIQARDTFFTLSRRFNVSIQSIVDANPGVFPNNLTIGQVICIPVSNPGPPICPEGSFSYTIVAGDTLFSLAQRFGVTQQSILNLNPSILPNDLRVAQIICIPNAPTPPTPSTCPEGSFSYTIVAGDTLFSLAQRFGVTTQSIMNLNPSIQTNDLMAGQMICIPNAPTPPTPSTCPEGSFSYTIMAGDTLFLLARRFGVTTQSIMDLNPNMNPNNLRVGQVICIPNAPAPPVCPEGSFSYTIMAGDTLFLLAQRFGVTTQSIINLNPSINPNDLRAGQVICIPNAPAPPTCPEGSFSYTIMAGDTLFLLARRFGVTTQSIMNLNPNINPNNLRVGQVICIPNAPAPPVCPEGSFSYTIMAGDTLFLLAQRFGVTAQSIMNLNPSINPNDLRIGQIICIPKAPAPPTCPEGSFAYTIMIGDSIASLAQRFGVTPQSILDANPGLDPADLVVGQVICIPNAATTPACPEGTFSYTIMAGDSIASLSQRFGVTAQSILDLNPGLDPANLMVGQQICIPGVVQAACTCEQNLAAAKRNIALLRGESCEQIFNDTNYGSSTATTVATLVTTTELRFDAVDVTFPGDFTCRFTQGMAYAFFVISAAGGLRCLAVRDNFGIWHTFEFNVM